MTIRAAGATSCPPLASRQVSKSEGAYWLRSRAAISRAYLTGGCWPDLISVIPTAACDAAAMAIALSDSGDASAAAAAAAAAATQAFGNSSRYIEPSRVGSYWVLLALRVVQLLRLLRLQQVPRLFQRWEPCFPVDYGKLLLARQRLRRVVAYARRSPPLTTAALPAARSSQPP